MKAPHNFHEFQKDISGCGVFGVINTKRGLISGDMPINAMASMRDRGNGLGGGFAAYGIYPERSELYAFHVMGDDRRALEGAEAVLRDSMVIHDSEELPTRKTAVVKNPPVFWRYFVSAKEEADRPDNPELTEPDYMVDVVMRINNRVPGAFVFSSGKNMGAFKGVGYPEDMAEFFRLDEYKAYIWTGHNRFPTNSPGWWGGAHPFSLLDWSIVHNGEISSYGINRRYLCEHDYLCTMLTDTEVVAYELDLLIRRHGLSKEMASKVFAPPFWDEIERMEPDQRELYTALRATYGSAMLNGPFAILVADAASLWGLNDRVKLRPLVVAEKDDMVFMSSEESSIREVCPELNRVYMPKAGEPVIVEVEG
jgi:glutamate synthase domain-containing protein 1